MTPEELEVRLNNLSRTARRFLPHFVFAVDAATMRTFMELQEKKERIYDLGFKGGGIAVAWDRSVTPKQGVKVMVLDKDLKKLIDPPTCPFRFTCLSVK